MESTDPLSQLRTELQATIQASKAVRRVMGSKADKNFGGAFDTNTDADVPRILIEPVGGPTNINNSSGLVQLTQNYNLLVDSGDQDENKIAHPLLWAVFCVVASSLHGSALTALKWKGESYVKSFAVSSSTLGAPNPLVNLGTSGMQAVCVVSVNMAFSKNLVAEYAETGR